MRLAKSGGIGDNAFGVTSIWKPEVLNGIFRAAKAKSGDLAELTGQGPGVLANPALMSGSIGRLEQRPPLVSKRGVVTRPETNRTNGTIVDFAGALANRAVAVTQQKAALPTQ
jgi:hypothetical protein